MGKQVRFYTLSTDEIKLVDFVLSIPKAYLLRTKTRLQRIETVDRDSIINTPDPSLHHLFIGIKSLPIPWSDVTEIRAITYSEEKLDFVETGEIFYSVSTNAPVIEFSRSFVRKDNNLVQGRIWCEFYRLTDDRNHLEYKGDDFKALYETLSGWIRKNFKKLKGVDGYFGQEALAWYESGGRIE